MKTINMELREYEQDLNMQRQLGICDALDQVRLFLISKRLPSEFFGAGNLDPRQMKCKLMIDILNELKFDPVDIQKATTVIVPDAPKVEQAPVSESQPAQSDCCSGESSCAPEAPIEPPVAQ